MSNYGVYRCEFCHAEFMTLDEKFKHVRKFHKNSTVKDCNIDKDFRQSNIYEYLLK